MYVRSSVLLIAAPLAFRLKNWNAGHSHYTGIREQGSGISGQRQKSGIGDQGSARLPKHASPLLPTPCSLPCSLLPIPWLCPLIPAPCPLLPASSCQAPRSP